MRKAMWDARIEHLEGRDVIEVICNRCGHQRDLKPMQIIQRIKPDACMAKGDLTLDTKILHLAYHMRCTRCPAGPNGRPHRDFRIRVYQPRDDDPPPNSPPPIQMRRRAS